MVNVLTKKVATISGIAFTVAFFIVFECSEKSTTSGSRSTRAGIGEIPPGHARRPLQGSRCNVRPGNVLVAVRNPNRLEHLRPHPAKDRHAQDRYRGALGAARDAGRIGRARARTRTRSSPSDETEGLHQGGHPGGEGRQARGADGGAGHGSLRGHGADGARLQSSRIVMGLSPKLTPAEQGAQVGAYWEKLPEPRPSLSLEIVLENQKDVVFFNLGPHPPRLWPEDVDLAAPALAGAEREGARREAASSRHHRSGAAAHGPRMPEIGPGVPGDEGYRERGRVQGRLASGSAGLRPAACCVGDANKHRP